MSSAKPSTFKAKIGEDAVKNATGKNWEQWFKLLDRAGAAKMNHKQIVALLVEHHDVGPWWQQMITVTYERARGLRQLHQKANGYSISGSRTIDASAKALFNAFVDPKRRDHWLGPRAAKLVIRKAKPHTSLRITWCDGRTNLDVNLVSKSPGKASLAVEHAKLTDAKEAAKFKAYWTKRLDKLQAMFER